ncbi:hypothetical protein HAX54_024579 [Datura stramonium]|uniref:S1-like domain-containing protein n=1 Tax=Datura stramonium TaxID=4076 RepID=A0ABS8V0T7_DATST|nr:hypothetical protein [Datura stramonium]
MLGDGRFVATSINGIKHVCHIPGKMHNKVWIAAGDIVLLSLRGYKDDKEDVIIKYMPDEVRLLKANGELLENIRLNDVLGEEDEGAGDDYIVFDMKTLKESKISVT